MTPSPVDPLRLFGRACAGRERSGSGPTVLWLHDHMLDSSVWTPLWDALPSLHHVSLDLPGHGVSPPIEDDNSPIAVTRRIADIAQVEGASIVVGLGLGAHYAIRVLVEAPTLFDGAVLASPMEAGAMDADSRWGLYRDLLDLYQRKGFGPCLRDRVFARADNPLGALPREESLRDRLWDVVGRHGWWDLRDGRIVMHLSDGPRETAVRAIAPRLLLTYGDRGGTGIMAWAAGVARVRPKTIIEVLEGAGDLCLLEAPFAASAMLASFLRAVGHAVPVPAHPVADRSETAPRASRE